MLEAMISSELRVTPNEWLISIKCCHDIIGYYLLEASERLIECWTKAVVKTIRRLHSGENNERIVLSPNRTETA